MGPISWEEEAGEEEEEEEEGVSKPPHLPPLSLGAAGCESFFLRSMNRHPSEILEIFGQVSQCTVQRRKGQKPVGALCSTSKQCRSFSESFLHISGRPKHQVHCDTLSDRYFCTCSRGEETHTFFFTDGTDATFRLSVLPGYSEEAE